MSAPDPQEQYDDAMFDYTTGDYDTAPDVDILAAGAAAGIAELLAYT